jgi:hypothetical protein
MSEQQELPSIKQCRDCQQTFLVDGHGFLRVPYSEEHGGLCPHCRKPLDIKWEEGGDLSYNCPECSSTSAHWMSTQVRCPRCHQARRQKNVRVYPPCPLCGVPTYYSEFLREYEGYWLDCIKVCCVNCAPQFASLPEPQRLWRLRRAMVKEYGEVAVIYGLHYDESQAVHHIGRTKHLEKRMYEYRRDWHRAFHHYSVLEEVPFGALSMERETRWLLHALKHGWPIDNFDQHIEERLISPDQPNTRGGIFRLIPEARARELQKKEMLLADIADFEPLTAPFEVLEPLLQRFSNTSDAHIAHWFVGL